MKRIFLSSVLRKAVLVLLVLHTIVAFGVSGSERVKVGIAWQPSPESYGRVVRSILAADGEPVILPQVRPAGFDHDSLRLAGKYIDDNGILLPEYATAVKRITYHGSGVEAALRDVDAVVFIGGGDVSPTLFATPESWHGLVEERNYDTTRDLSEYLTMAYCLDHDIPLLGLCRGMQLLGVVSGAPLVQDLGLYYRDLGREYRHIHRSLRDADGKRHYMAHSVRLVGRGTLLRGIEARDEVAGVPSWHHQAVGDTSGTPLRITAVSDDEGVLVIEAIERTDKRFALGVQYHPEVAVDKHRAAESDAENFMPAEQALRYFIALIEAAKKH